MSLESWASVAELIGSIGVIVSVVYLAIQISQNTRQVRSENLESSVSKFVDAVFSFMRTEEDAKLFRRAVNDYEGLNAAEQARFLAWATDLARGFEAVAIKHRDGLVDSRYYAHLQENMAAWLACPGCAAVWQIMRDGLPSWTVGEVEQGLRRYTGKSAIEFYPFLRIGEGGS